jgi:hypothetical protein
MSLLLWYIPSGLLALLLFLMLRNRSHKVCPWFFGYVAFGVGADVMRMAVHNRPAAYYATYWITEAGYCVLGIIAMYEVFRVIIRGLGYRWWSYLVFPGIVIAGTSLSLSRVHAVPSKVGGLLYYIVIGEITVRFVQVLAVIVTFIPLVGFRRYRYALGVAAGFGFYSTVELLNMIKISEVGVRFAFWWRIISVTAYSFSVLIWIWFFRTPIEDEDEFPAILEDAEVTTLSESPNRLERLRLSLVRIGAGL